MIKNLLDKINAIIWNIDYEANSEKIHNFLSWFYLKINIHFNRKQSGIVPNIWDIYDVELWENIWSELNKKRPCIVISKASFNKWNTVIIIPVKSIKKDSRLWSITFEIDINNTWLNQKSYVSPINIKEVSKKRLLQKIWKLNREDTLNVKNTLLKLFDIKKEIPPNGEIPSSQS